MVGKWRWVWALVVLVAAHGCGDGGESGKGAAYVPSAWSSPLPKLELSCGGRACL